MSRPEHKFREISPNAAIHDPPLDQCSLCGRRESAHRTRKRSRAEYHRTYVRKEARPRAIDCIIGIDGEGKGRRPHIYNYLAAADENGRTWSVENAQGLTTIQCLDFILSLPTRSLVVGFALGYDRTKWLADLDNDSLRLLVNEKLRAAKTKTKSGKWRIVYKPLRFKLVDGKLVRTTSAQWAYSINLVNGKLTVSRGKHSTSVWDVFKFYQSKFTKALKAWKIGDQTAISHMERMKDQRSAFDTVPQEDIKAYCKQECLNLAQLARALISAHKDAGLELKHYYGAGSTASALLDNLQIRSKRGEHPKEMEDAISRAFFGGRFENSVIGAIDGPVYNYDISSAYPYHISLLPCLEHGRWTRTTNATIGDLYNAQLALCHWSIDRIHTPSALKWGPLPVRAKDGTIAFPLNCRGGWCWKDEFLMASECGWEATCDVAWLYETDCDCKPFADLPRMYLERLRLGKEDGRGQPFKLGPNAVYGKLAQSTGISPPFQSWIWAGNITSSTRAQLLQAIVNSKRRDNVIMFATDGVWSREPIKFAPPRDTGTSHVAKPLGGWEEKVFPRGVFCVRPGVYFPLNPTAEQIDEVRARGLGKKVLYERWGDIVDAWNAGEEVVELGGMQRFVGIKSALSVMRGSAFVDEKRPQWVMRSADYGEWITHKILLSFDPKPKRESIIGKRGQWNELKPWARFNWESEPYSKATISPDAVLLQTMQQIAEEQPDGEFAEVNGTEET